MQIPQTALLNFFREKRYLSLAFLGILALIIIYMVFLKDPGRPPSDALEKAISKTIDARNFRYKVETKTNINGKKNTFSHVAGDKFRPDNLHIKGEVMKSKIEIYQINEKIYAKDNFGGKWVTVDINEINQDGNFMNELNPLENFSFKELGEVNYQGLVKSDQGKLWSYEVRPTIDNPYMEALWTDFTYNIQVRPGDGKIGKAEIRAKGKENENDEIVVTIEFFDYNKVKPVNPPV